MHIFLPFYYFFLNILDFGKLYLYLKFSLLEDYCEYLRNVTCKAVFISFSVCQVLKEYWDSLSQKSNILILPFWS